MSTVKYVEVVVSETIKYIRTIESVTDMSPSFDTHVKSCMTDRTDGIISGPVSMFGAFFSLELERDALGNKRALGAQMLADLVSSCCYLGIRDAFMRPIVTELLDAIEEGRFEEPLHLVGRTLPVYIYEYFGYRRLNNVRIMTDLTGVLRMPTECRQLNDKMLQFFAERYEIEELNLNNNWGVTSLKPVAATLLKLRATGCCGLSDEGLNEAKAITQLDVSENPRITSIKSFASSLRLLAARGKSGICDKGLETCHNIDNLDVDDNPRVTQIKPFAASLLKLEASCLSGISDSELSCAVKLADLRAKNNSKITTVAPFASTLKRLDAGGFCGINDAGLVEAHGIEYLDVSENEKVTTVAPFAATLRVLFAQGRCGIDNIGLLSARAIVRFNCQRNDRITNTRPFESTLRHFNKEGDGYNFNVLGKNVRETVEDVNSYLDQAYCRRIGRREMR